MKRVRLSVGLFLTSACLAFLADLITKIAVVERLQQGSSVIVVGDFIRISHVRNLGASFGLFPGNTHTLIAISSVAALVVIYLAARSRGRVPAMCFLGLILGGALGNLYDRLMLGEVIDFVDVGFGSHRWPVFNVADVAVTIGVFLLLLDYLRQTDGHGDPVEVSEDADDRTEVDVGQSGARE